MPNLTIDTQPVEDVNLDELSFFDPESDENFEPKTLV